MTLRAADCKLYLKQIADQSYNQETLSGLKAALTSKNGAKWKGPIAWSLLVQSCKASRELDEHWGELVWLACGIINAQEGQLTLKSGDFEKMLCNVSNCFMNAALGKWACILSGLLFERLKFYSNDSINVLTKEVSLGAGYLAVAPRIPKISSAASPLLLSCQILWLRLQISQTLTMIDNVSIREFLFETGGIVDATVMVAEDKFVETFIHYWRHFVCSLLKRSVSWDILAIEMELFEALERRLSSVDIREILVASRWKNVCAYAGLVQVNRITNMLDQLQLYNLPKAHDFLVRLHSFTNVPDAAFI